MSVYQGPGLPDSSYPGAASPLVQLRVSLPSYQAQLPLFSRSSPTIKTAPGKATELSTDRLFIVFFHERVILFILAESSCYANLATHFLVILFDFQKTKCQELVWLFLAVRDVKVDCLSCVSGGGYTGTAYLDWKYRHEKKDDPKWHQEFFNYMRSRAGYFCNWKNPIVAIFDSLLIIALIALVSAVIPIIIWMSFACPVAYVVDYLVGDLLRAEGCVGDLAGNQTAFEATHHHDCSVEGNAYRKVVLFASLLAVAVLSFMLKNFITQGKALFKFISISALTILALLFFPWAIHAFLEGTPVWAQVLILVLAALIWFSFPLFRQQASLIMVLYAYAFIIHSRVYGHSLLGLDYSEYGFDILVWVSAIVLTLIPYIGSIQQRLMHVFNR
ncbi:hypothetical protein ACROYT_G019882 [Oculina patagonica]